MKKEQYLKKKIKPYDPSKVNSVEDALMALQECSFQGRNLGSALEVLTQMVRDENCFRVLTLAGAMIPAGMDEIICQLIERKIINAIVTTAANISHVLVNCYLDSNQGHYKGWLNTDDEDLHQNKINRIYDTFLPEENYVIAGRELHVFLEENFEVSNGKKNIIPPSIFFKKLGKTLPHRNFMKIAADNDIPVFCGATSDSELGLNLIHERKKNKINIILDELEDIEIFSQIIINYSSFGTLIIGGGVPRNWAQQIFPYLEQAQYLSKEGKKLHGYDYSVRLHSAASYDGGLSGCTISESISWGKYAANATHQSVWGDATITFPLLITALFQRLDKKK